MQAARLRAESQGRKAKVREIYPLVNWEYVSLIGRDMEGRLGERWRFYFLGERLSANLEFFLLRPCSLLTRTMSYWSMPFLLTLHWYLDAHVLMLFSAL
jgi:hypothetical protein